MFALTVLCVGLALVGIGVAVSGLLSIVFIAAGIAVALLALVVWLKRGNESPSPQKPPRTGYVGREGSKADLSRATFGEKLDLGIDNTGEIDASDADFQ
jgi:hypothetical protein